MTKRFSKRYVDSPIDCPHREKLHSNKLGFDFPICTKNFNGKSCINCNSNSHFPEDCPLLIEEE